MPAPAHMVLRGVSVENIILVFRTFGGKTGVLATLGKGQPVVVLRADMDALPILEPDGLDFRSQVRPRLVNALHTQSSTRAVLGE